MPTRAIALREGSPDGAVRLAQTAGLQGQHVALSYCWGSGRSFCTTRSTYEGRLSGIRLEDMPQLYKDAVRISRELGYDYIWIDALCIIQDDREDWQRECPRMADVYGNAVLTINGPAATCTDDSLLRDREVLGSCEIPVKWCDNLAHGTAVVTQASPNKCSVRPQQDSPLDTRAWAAQEFLLSPRILSLGSENTYMVCSRHVRYEAVKVPMKQTEFSTHPSILQSFSLHLEKNFLLQLQQATTVGEMHILWYQVVQCYTQRSLTHGNDKLPAVEGIAQYFARYLPHDGYIAGIWANDIVNVLTWVRTYQVYKRTPAKFPATESAPTWSWASINDPV